MPCPLLGPRTIIANHLVSPFGNTLLTRNNLPTNTARPLPMVRTFSAVSGSCLESLPRHTYSLQLRRPPLLHCLLELCSNNKASDLLQAVKKLLDLRAIEEVEDTSSLGYYSRLFLVPKPDGSFRPIIDLMKIKPLSRKTFISFSQ